MSRLTIKIQDPNQKITIKNKIQFRESEMFAIAIKISTKRLRSRLRSKLEKFRRLRLRSRLVLNDQDSVQVQDIGFEKKRFGSRLVLNDQDSVQDQK